MWSSRVALLLLLALAGCGFTPVLGIGGGAASLQNAVQLDEPGNRFDFVMSQRIADRLGRPDTPRYSLTIAPVIDVDPAAFTPDRKILRYTINGTATFRLTELATGTVTEGLVRSLTVYSATGTTVATLSAEEDARDRLAVLLADQIVSRLIATAK